MIYSIRNCGCGRLSEYRKARLVVLTMFAYWGMFAIFPVARAAVPACVYTLEAPVEGRTVLSIFPERPLFGPLSKENVPKASVPSIPGCGVQERAHLPGDAAFSLIDRVAHDDVSSQEYQDRS
jgi:hypothetical protein